MIDWRKPTPRKSRRRVWPWAVACTLLTLAGVTGRSWRQYATLDARYRAKLEAHVAANPNDSEGWFALATCSARVKDGFGEVEFDLAALDRAIELDPRPAYLFVRAGVSADASLDKLKAVDGDNALTWCAVADRTQGDAEAALAAINRALACPKIDDHGRERMRIHRRFARAFFGSGFQADSLILRHEYVTGFWTGYWPLRLYTEAEIARRCMAGDLAGAATGLRALHRFGVQLEEEGSSYGAQTCGRELRFRASEDLCGLALETGCMGHSRRTSLGFCGNVYANDDPWIVRNSWPGRTWYSEDTVAGIWLPVWYLLQRDRFHALTETVGQPGQPPWRRADQWLSREREATPCSAKGRVGESVRDEATFDRLLARVDDAAVLSLIRSEWKPSPRAAPKNAAQVYVLLKLRALRLEDATARVSAVTTLVSNYSALWGPDAWRLAAEIDRTTFIREAIGHLWQGCLLHVLVLQEVTGQQFGLDSDRWREWLNKQSPRRN